MYSFDNNEETQFRLDVSRGYHDKLRPIHIFGFNRLVATTFETVFNDGGGMYVFPANATTASCVSSSTDTKTLVIEGLDVNYYPISETVTLTGTTPVVTSQSFWRINNAYLTNGLNVGNITITVDSKTVAYIEAGSGIHSAAVYTVPADCSMYINSVSFSSGTVNNNKYLTGRASMQNSTGYHVHFWNSTWAIGFMEFNVNVPFRVPEKTDITFDAKSSSGENEISIYANCILESSGWISDELNRRWVNV